MNLVGKRFTRGEMLRVRKAMVARCKEVIAGNIKLEEPINFGKFFSEALCDSAVNEPSIATAEELSTTSPNPQYLLAEKIGIRLALHPATERCKIGRKGRNSKSIASERKGRTRTINIDKTVTLEREAVARSFVASPGTNVCENCVRFPGIESKKY